MESDPSLDLFVFDVSAIEGRFIKIKPSPALKDKGQLGLEFGVGVFDNRLLRELIEKKSRQTNPITISSAGTVLNGVKRSDNQSPR